MRGRNYLFFSYFLTEAPNVVINIYLMDKKPITEADTTENTKLEYILQIFSQSCEQGFKIKIKFLDSTLLLSYTVGNLFNASDESAIDSNWISLPWIDQVGQQDKLLLTMTSHLDSEAIVGIDIDYSYLMEDFVFLLEEKAYYFAVLDKSSRSVVYHPQIDKKPGSQFPQGISFDTIEGTYNCLTVYLHLRRPSVLACWWRQPRYHARDVNKYPDR